MIKNNFIPFHAKESSDKLSIKKESYFCFGTRETCLSRDEVYIKWLIDHGCKSYIDIPNNNVYEYFIDKCSSLKTFAMLVSYMEKNWKKHLAEYPKKKLALIKSAKLLSNSVKTKNNKIILKQYLNYIKHSYIFCEYIWSPWAVIYKVEKEVMSKFPDKMNIIMSLDRPIEFIKMKNKLHNFALKQLVKKYSWLNVYSSYDVPYSEEDFQKLMSETNKEEVEKEFIQFKKNKTAFRKFLKTIKDSKIRRKVEIAHEYAFLKTDRIDAWKMAMFYKRNFYLYLTALADNLTLKDAANLSIKEIIALLNNKIIFDLSDIKLRSKNKIMYYFHNNSINIISDGKIIKNVFEKLHGNKKDIKEFKGTIACRGYAKGNARIIAHSSDLKKIKEGDIFVAKYTFPSFTPYMLKCKAIITDEGGIISHASVISREYNIPCIVGTKIATSVLKDGDYVEVNADKGVVRKIR